MGCQMLPQPYGGSPDALELLGLVAGCWQAPSSPAPAQLMDPPPACTWEEAGTPGPLSPGSLPAAAAALLAFLRVLIGQGAEPPAALFPEVS